MMKRVSLIGATISGNRGAEAMLCTVIGEIREHLPDTKFNIFSYYPIKDRALCNDRSIDILPAAPSSLLFIIFPFSSILGLLKLFGIDRFKHLMPESVKALDDSDVLIDISGVSFMDGRVKFMPYNILTILPSILVRTPVVKFSQAIGPFSNPLVQFPARTFLSRCERIFARGHDTELNLKKLRLKSDKIDKASDLAFLYRECYSLSEENPEYIDELIGSINHKKIKGIKMIGICPSSVIAKKAKKEGWNYIYMLSEIVKRISRMGYGILLFPNATREHSRKLRNNDLPVIEKTGRYLAAFNEYPENLLIVKKDINTAGIKRLMNSCELNIVSRFHAMIGALELGIPVIVLGWGHKYKEVMMQFELQDYVFDYRDRDITALIEFIGSALENRDIIHNKIRDGLEKVRLSSEIQIKYIVNFLLKYEK